MQAPKDCHDLRDYLRCFDFVRPYLQTQEALAAAAYDVMEQAAQDGVAYIEIRFAPSLSMDKGLTCSQTIQAVIEGIARAEERYPIKGNVLVIGMRQEDLPAITAIFDEAIALTDEKVVGIDLAIGDGDQCFWTNGTVEVAVKFYFGKCLDLLLSKHSVPPV